MKIANKWAGIVAGAIVLAGVGLVAFTESGCACMTWKMVLRVNAGSVTRDAQEAFRADSGYYTPDLERLVEYGLSFVGEGVTGEILDADAAHWMVAVRSNETAWTCVGTGRPGGAIEVACQNPRLMERLLEPLQLRPAR